MKKTLTSIILAAAILVTACGCEGENAETTTTTAAVTTTTTAAETTTATEAETTTTAEVTTAETTTTEAETTTESTITETITTIPDTTVVSITEEDTADVTTTADATTVATTSTTTITSVPSKKSSDYPSIIDTSDSSLKGIRGFINNVSDMVNNHYYYAGFDYFENRFTLDYNDCVEYADKESYQFSGVTATDYCRVINGPFMSNNDVYAYLASVYTDDMIESFRNEYGGYGAFMEKNGKFYARETSEYMSFIKQEGGNTISIRSKTNKRIILDYISASKIMQEYWYSPVSIVLIDDGNGYKISSEIAENPDEVIIGNEIYSTDLETLELVNISNEDILNLIYMTNLKELEISSSHNLTNIWIIDSCPSIEKLTVSSNVQSLPYLFNIKHLFYAPFADGDVDISCLSGGNLEHLEILGTTKTNLNISKLSDFTKLKTLSLRQNNIYDFSPLETLTKLEELDLSYTGINDISFLKGFTKLKKLYLAGNNITDVTPLKKLSKLEYLSLFRNDISDATPLYSLSDLEELRIENNDLSEKDIHKLKQALPQCYIN